MINIPDELLDVVDAQDQVIATMWRSQWHEPKDGYFRAVNAFLKNPQGQVCIFRRSANKSYLPLHWALVGGCVSSGEDYDVSIVREVAEEIDITMHASTMKCLGYVTPADYGTVFKKIYEIGINADHIVYNPQDFCEYRWLYPHELLEMHKGGQQIEPAMLYFVQRFYTNPIESE
ncbi:MAG: NUDIX domain-containing protein [Candidatus Babeliales bacterium]|nr:NUDIX domain-containing protein [Candidatus Babeliales bacterium]